MVVPEVDRQYMKHHLLVLEEMVEAMEKMVKMELELKTEIIPLEKVKAVLQENLENQKETYILEEVVVLPEVEVLDINKLLGMVD